MGNVAGSPFLVLTKANFGANRLDKVQRSVYENTYERYTSQEGAVEWDVASITLGNPGCVFKMNNKHAYAGRQRILYYDSNHSNY
jgi:hypothetical protein